MTTSLTRALSLAFAIISLGALAYVDIAIATKYTQADVKTKALFGLVELGEFNNRYLILMPAILSILLVVRLIKKKRFKIWDFVALILGLISIAGIVTSSWKILI